MSQIAPAPLAWTALGAPAAAACAGGAVALTGYPVPPSPVARARHFLLVAEPACCPGCAPRDPFGAVEVVAAAPMPMLAGALRLSGRWQIQSGAPRYRLTEARTIEPPGWQALTRRAAIAGPLMCLAAGVPRARAQPAARSVLAAGPAVDLHSHAGGLASRQRILGGGAFGPVAAPMRAGGMAIACLAVVSDSPTHRVMADHRIHPFRDPRPGELYAYGQTAFSRVHDLVREQGLPVIADLAGLRRARAGAPGAIIAAEGADFLEGQVDRVDEAHARWTLRHLQLTHYRVNELGDIQTEAPVHGGLTDVGAAVIRRCNQLGIVVDVAHGTFDLVRRAAAVTTRPLVLSHTSLSARPRPFTRLIGADHARVIAGTGGVIGIWPPAALFPTLDALAAGIARMVDAVGVEHVGLGTDMRGLVGPSVFPDYDSLPHLTEALLRVGFSPIETGKLLGGNYARVFAAVVG
jgi:membrane dipeptidase